MEIICGEVTARNVQSAAYMVGDVALQFNGLCDWRNSIFSPVQHVVCTGEGLQR